VTANNRDELLKVGTLVKIRHTNFARALIVEYRGRLGVGGARVYRVRYRGKPRPAYVEVPEDQLEVVPADE
jgi:hypothetical protein